VFGRRVAVVDNFVEVAAGVVALIVVGVVVVFAVMAVDTAAEYSISVQLLAVRLQMCWQQRRNAVRIAHNTTLSRFDTCYPVEQPSLSSKPLPVPG